MSYRTLEAKITTPGVLSVTLNRPEIRNAFNEDMIGDLTQVFQKEASRDEIRVVILRGAGEVFCAGGDLNWMKKSIGTSFEENLEDTRRLTQMFAVLNECPKPVIGAIHGAAIGGGVGLVSVCDIVIAVSETQFSLSEVRLGIVPACIGPFVIAKVGASYARELFLSAERFRADKARAIGLVHQVVPDQKNLEEVLQRTVQNILQCGPQALSVAKKLVLDLSWPERREALKDPLESVARVLAELRITKEGQEGIQAFLEKRKPSWLNSK